MDSEAETDIQERPVQKPSETNPKKRVKQIKRDPNEDISSNWQRKPHLADRIPVPVLTDGYEVDEEGAQLTIKSDGSAYTVGEHVFVANKVESLQDSAAIDDWGAPPNAFRIARIVAFKGSMAHVNWLLRPSDVYRRAEDSRELYITFKTEWVEVSEFRGKCIVQCRKDVRMLDKFREKSSQFWYAMLYYEPFARLYDVVPVNLLKSLNANQIYELGLQATYAVMPISSTKTLCESSRKRKAPDNAIEDSRSESELEVLRKQRTEWPFRYLDPITKEFEQHCKIPRAKRLGESYQIDVPDWPGHPLVYYTKVGRSTSSSSKQEIRLVEPSFLSENAATNSIEKLDRSKPWVQEMPRGYIPRGGETTSTPVSLPIKELPGFVSECQKNYAESIEVHPSAVNFLDACCSIFVTHGTNDIKEAYVLVSRLSRKQLREPDLQPLELMTFKSELDPFAQRSWHHVFKVVGTKPLVELCQYYWVNLPLQATVPRVQLVCNGKDPVDEIKSEASSNSGTTTNKNSNNGNSNEDENDDDEEGDDEEDDAHDADSSMICAICKTTDAPEWKSLPGFVPLPLSPEYTDKKVAMCARCARLWYRYKVRWLPPETTKSTEVNSKLLEPELIDDSRSFDLERERRSKRRQAAQEKKEAAAKKRREARLAKKAFKEAAKLGKPPPTENELSELLKKEQATAAAAAAAASSTAAASTSKDTPPKDSKSNKKAKADSKQPEEKSKTKSKSEDPTLSKPKIRAKPGPKPKKSKTAKSSSVSTSVDTSGGGDGATNKDKDGDDNNNNEENDNDDDNDDDDNDNDSASSDGNDGADSKKSGTKKKGAANVGVSQMSLDQVDELLAALDEPFVSENASHSNYCAVCGQLDPSMPQETCASCGLNVHTACYGTSEYHQSSQSSPQSSSLFWLCDCCANSRGELTNDANYQCVMCPPRIPTYGSWLNGIGTSAPDVLKSTMDKSWCHLRCAVWAPNVRFGNPSQYRDIDLALTPKESWEGQCSICLSSLPMSKFLFLPSWTAQGLASAAASSAYSSSSVTAATAPAQASMPSTPQPEPMSAPTTPTKNNNTNNNTQARSVEGTPEQGDVGQAYLASTTANPTGASSRTNTNTIPPHVSARTGLKIKCHLCDDRFHISCAADKGFMLGFTKEASPRPVIVCNKHVDSDLLPMSKRDLNLDLSVMQKYVNACKVSKRRAIPVMERAEKVRKLDEQLLLGSTIASNVVIFPLKKEPEVAPFFQNPSAQFPKCRKCSRTSASYWHDVSPSNGSEAKEQDEIVVECPLCFRGLNPETEISLPSAASIKRMQGALATKVFNGSDD